MSTWFVAFAVPEDVLALAEVWVPEDGGPRLRRLEPREHCPFSELKKSHPDAHLLLEVPIRAVWNPPEEPVRSGPTPWYREGSQRRRHREILRASLQTFLNRMLDDLSGALVTGYWVLSRTRVRVVEMRPLPHRKLEERLRQSGVSVRGGNPAR